MAAAAEKEPEHSAPAPAAGHEEHGGGSKLPVILAGVNLFVTLAMVGILFVSFQRDKKKPSVDDIQANATHEVAKAEGHGEGGEHGGGEAKEGGEHAEGAKGEKKRATGDFGKMITLEQFTVNLSTPGSVSPRYVRVNISLEVPTDDAESEVNSKMPQVRNAIIDLFNSKRPSDLATAEGRDYLKDEIRNALNSFLVNGKVKGVFFTNFALTS